MLGCPGAEKIGTYAQQMKKEDIDSSESLAAKDYFQFYHEGLNRRNDDPVNSRLNYGYNAFNLVDDLIEPFRALVDLVAHENTGTNEWPTKAERSSLAHVLHNACLVNGTKVSVLYAIELMSESYKRILMHELEEELVLPTVISIESMEGITE